jgi:uridine phosphorylase
MISANTPSSEIESGAFFKQDQFPAESALINPAREAHEAPVAARTVLTFARPDYQLLCRLARAVTPPRYIWDCACREGHWHGRPVTIVAPALGAPYAAMVLEKAIALGARMVLALGWCGSLQTRAGIGTLVLPTSALGGDGTSRHYAPGPTLEPDRALCRLLEQALEAIPTPWLPGPILTTDAYYRETASLVQHYQDKGVLGLDLELAALFAVGRFRRVPVAGLLVVSDELAAGAWRPGHRTPRFRQARETAAHLVLTAAAAWDGDRV